MQRFDGLHGVAVEDEVVAEEFSMARTPMPCSMQTGMTWWVKERKCASITLMGICAASKWGRYCAAWPSQACAEWTAGSLWPVKPDVADFAGLARSNRGLRSRNAFGEDADQGASIANDFVELHTDRSCRSAGGPSIARVACYTDPSSSAVQLGHQEDFVAVKPLPEGLAHTDFADAVVVIPTIIEEGDAAVDAAVEQADALGWIVLFAEVIAAHADGGDALAGLAELAINHVGKTRGVRRELGGAAAGEMPLAVPAPAARAALAAAADRRAFCAALRISFCRKDFRFELMDVAGLARQLPLLKLRCSLSYCGFG